MSEDKKDQVIYDYINKLLVRLEKIENLIDQSKDEVSTQIDDLEVRLDVLEHVYKSDGLEYLNTKVMNLMNRNGSLNIRYAELEKKLSELESRGNYNKDYGLELHKEIIKLMEMSGYLINRVSKLESSCTSDHDERINDLENIGIENRLLNLEEINEHNRGLIERIGILGKALDSLSDENHKLRKIPHKCPVCDGEGNQRKEIHPKLAEFERLPAFLAIMCKACEGKGIVWG